MRMEKTILVLLAVLAGCGGGDNSPPPPAGPRIVCADVTNAGEPSACKAKMAWISQARAFETAAGQVSRAQPISASALVENRATVNFGGFIEAAFDAGCGGSPDPWVIMPRSALVVPPGESVTPAVSGECGDMPPGARTLSVTLYAADGAAVIDRAVVRFQLVE